MKTLKETCAMKALLTAAFGLAILGAPAAARAGKKCSPDSVKVGAACVDIYEASVWSIADANLIKKVQQGKATLARLTAGGATQLGIGFTDDYPCADNGNDCKDQIYAVSVAGIPPSANITWFQAQQACGNSTKRLLTNAEWQMAAAGTPDGAPCVLNVLSTGSTGTPGCVSTWGTFDMVGNVGEWVADWVPAGTGCAGWGAFSDDAMCLSGASTTDTGPGALIRGGFLFPGFGGGSNAGVFAVFGRSPPKDSFPGTGLRCAR